MSERDGYEPGVPCWVDTRQPDPQAAVDFYTRLFGWEARDAAFGLRDAAGSAARDVAAIGRRRLPRLEHAHLGRERR